MTKPTCASCRFFWEKDGDESCRRFPPVYLVDETRDNVKVVFASTASDQWCGEHEPGEGE